ncbi:hypothetical protein K438DRAFT_433153 [Mycena galopus ATCC 62051]|nr:hypothetical protein K438DRAFT_433153 [Mycena galopus ATCC 62051]
MSTSVASQGQTATLAGTASNATLATTTTGYVPPKPERVYTTPYAHGPPGLGALDAPALDVDNPNVNVFAPAPPVMAKGSIGSGGSWDKAGLELGFSRAASHSFLGTFGSANAVPVSAVGAAVPGIRVVPSTAPSPFGAAGGGGRSVSSPFGATAARTPFGLGETRNGSTPHLSLDLDDAPPGAEGRWRLLGASVHSLLGSSSSLGASQEWSEGAGRRGTFGLSPAAQYHYSPAQSSEHGSFHSRLGNSSLNSESLSSASSHGPRLPSTTAGHSLYPSSGSGHSTSARARILAHAGSVEGPMSPTLSAFGHIARDGEHSGSSGSRSGSQGRRQENSSGSGSSAGEHGRGPLARAASPSSPLMSPWAGGLDANWRPT